MQTKDNYEAVAVKCTGKNQCGPEIQGTWSTIYDQSLRVLLEDGTRLLANFRYNMRPEDAEQVKKSGGDIFSAIYPTKEFDSTSADWKCDETMIGFA